MFQLRSLQRICLHERRRRRRRKRHQETPSEWNRNQENTWHVLLWLLFDLADKRGMKRETEREVFISQGFMSLSFLQYILYFFFLGIKPGVVFIREGENGIRLLASGRVLVCHSLRHWHHPLLDSLESCSSQPSVYDFHGEDEGMSRRTRQAGKEVVGKVQTKRTQREKGIVMTAASFSCLLLESKEGNSLRWVNWWEDERTERGCQSTGSLFFLLHCSALYNKKRGRMRDTGRVKENRGYNRIERETWHEGRVEGKVKLPHVQ